MSPYSIPLNHLSWIRTPLATSSGGIALLSPKINSIADMYSMSINDARCCLKRPVYSGVLGTITY
jgi:hypothetical protein